MLQETGNGFVVYYLAGSALMLLLIAAIVTYAFLHQKKVIQLKIQLHEEELRKQEAVFNALLQGEEKERERLARDLHDGIGAKLSGLKMNLEFLSLKANEHRELITKVFHGMTEALEEVRMISHNLQPSFYKDKTMEQLLLSYMEQLSSMNGCRYDLFMNPQANSIDVRIKYHCHRIVTELLHNIHKHAKASLASVQINVENSSIEIVVEDNGIGIYSKNSTPEGIGLKNIKNRLEACRGTINIDSSEKGTSIIIEIPLNSFT